MTLYHLSTVTLAMSIHTTLSNPQTSASWTQTNHSVRPTHQGRQSEGWPRVMFPCQKSGYECERSVPAAECVAQRLFGSAVYIKRTRFACLVLQVFIADPNKHEICSCEENRPREIHHYVAATDYESTTLPCQLLSSVYSSHVMFVSLLCGFLLWLFVVWSIHVYIADYVCPYILHGCFPRSPPVSGRSCSCAQHQQPSYSQ